MRRTAAVHVMTCCADVRYEDNSTWRLRRQVLEVEPILSTVNLRTRRRAVLEVEQAKEQRRSSGHCEPVCRRSMERSQPRKTPGSAAAMLCIDSMLWRGGRRVPGRQVQQWRHGVRGNGVYERQMGSRRNE